MAGKRISRALWKLRFCASVPNAREHLTKDCGVEAWLERENWNKINKIVSLCQQIKAAKEKAIIFSGLRPFQAQIADCLKSHEIEFLPIFADTAASKRFGLIEKFSSNGATALVTGTEVLNRGFDIITANHAIITDIQYSPEATLQAEDRIHRPGQTRTCHVYYLLTQGSIDEIMYELIMQKSKAIDHAINGEVRFEKVAQLLQELHGDVRLEIARKLQETSYLPVVEANYLTLEYVEFAKGKARIRKPGSGKRSKRKLKTHPDQLTLVELMGWG